MISPIDAWYVSQEEPVRACLLALRATILGFDPSISESWTHRMPMFRCGGKLFAYVWTDRKSGRPYVGIYRGLEVEHPKLVLGKRKKMKILYIDPEQDLPMKDLGEILRKARSLYPTDGQKQGR